jgi:DNA excision repair protein ERCC-6
MASSRKLKSILIISPATMLQHWLSEMAIWAPGIRRILIHSSADQHEFSNVSRKISPSMLRGANDWLQKARSQRLFEPIDSLDLQERDPNSFCGTAYAFVTTYENVRRNSEVWINHKWSYVIIDEAQKIRNPDADITLVLKRIRSPHRLALSGTPIQNDLKELWSLFDFVFPGRLGTLPSFLQEFGDPIKRGGYSNASPMQVQVAYRCALILKDLIHPYLLRRLKNNIMEVNRMPTKTEQVLFCRLTNRQRILYESFLQSDLVKNVLRGNAQLLGAITVLRKICNHPDLVCSPNKSSTDLFLQTGYCNDQGDDNSSDDELQEEESLTERSGKLQVLAKILPLWKKQGHRVLIFCQWKKMLNLIQTFFVRQGWKFGRLDGNTCIASRQKLVDKFNADDSYFAMLCTTRTGGVGLNLTGADRIILYDPDWNPQTDAQARERAWRFGQERPVTIFRLISAGTVEEKIYQRQIFKTALSNKVLQDAQQRRLFSQRDLKDLFSLKADGGSVISGGDGLTETGELTKGDGYVDPDYDENTNTNKNVDDGETMRTVLKSKGLAGVFDHGVVENPDHAKKASVREMEARAKIIAKEAQSALEQSVSHSATSSSGRFTPTWTGNNYNGNNQGRFGSSSAGVARNTPKSSSGALLAAHRQRQQQIQDPNQRVTTKNDAKQYTVLLEKIRGYIKAQAPTTHEILDAFQDAVGKKDAAIFRRLLKSVAVFHNPDGRWRLRSK